MPSDSEDSESSSDSGSEHELTANEGDSSDCDGEAEAATYLRGRVALVVAKCPREYVRDPSVKMRGSRSQVLKLGRACGVRPRDWPRKDTSGAAVWWNI